MADDDGPLLLELIFRTGAGLRMSSGLPWIQEASRVKSVSVTSTLLVGVEQTFLEYSFNCGHCTIVHQLLGSQEVWALLE